MKYSYIEADGILAVVTGLRMENINHRAQTFEEFSLVSDVDTVTNKKWRSRLIL